jgi:hypothetical protein
MTNLFLKKIPHKMLTLYNNVPITSLFITLGAFTLYFYSPDSFALAETDKVAEINELTLHVTKLAKNGCYITGCASALIGSIFAVAQQSLKIFGVASAVTLLAFKAPAFFTSAMLI